MKSVLILFGILICQVFAFGQISGFIPAAKKNADNMIGAPAPNFTLTKFLQAPQDASLQISGLQGNIIVLEFWATWCGSCRKSLADLNSLAEKFKGKPVVFLAVSKEPQSAITEFLQSHPNKLWIGVDSTGVAHRRYHVSAFPHTVIINKKGQIVANTTTTEITVERLGKLIRQNVLIVF